MRKALRFIGALVDLQSSVVWSFSAGLVMMTITWLAAFRLGAPDWIFFPAGIGGLLITTVGVSAAMPHLRQIASDSLRIDVRPHIGMITYPNSVRAALTDRYWLWLTIEVTNRDPDRSVSLDCTGVVRTRDRNGSGKPIRLRSSAHPCTIGRVEIEPGPIQVPPETTKRVDKVLVFNAMDLRDYEDYEIDVHSRQHELEIEDRVSQRTHVSTLAVGILDRDLWERFLSPEEREMMQLLEEGREGLSEEGTSSHL